MTVKGYFMYGNYSMDTLRMMNRVDGDIRRRAIYDPRLRNSINVNIKMYIFDHLRMYIFAIPPLDRYIFSIDKIFQ